MKIEEQLIALELDEPVAIIGAGVTGKSCFDLLDSANIACRVFDEGNRLPDAFAAHKGRVELGHFHPDRFNQYGTILLSPGIDTRRYCFAKQEHKLLSDIELFCRLTQKSMIGVTGSNGKSTVVTLLHEASKQCGLQYTLCGNIGLPVLSALQQNQGKSTCDGYIIELSSYHLEHVMSLQLDVGVWLNVSPDHLDRYKSYEAYAETKSHLFSHADVIVANADDPIVATYANDYSPRLLFSQQQENADFYADRGAIRHAGKTVFDMKNFSQVGHHHADNVMAVFAVAQQLGWPFDAVAKACQQFEPLPSRAVIVGEKNGVLFINDSKGTNVGATVAALQGIEQPIILIAGGQGKDQDFSELANVGKGRLKAAVLIGEDASQIDKMLSPVVDSQVADSLKNAFERALDMAQTGDVVMLSPACASLDMFSNYLQRGEAFEQLVKEWINA